MDELPGRLAALDSCAISDALDKLGLSGAVTGIRRLTTAGRISGRVHTVRMDKDDGMRSTRHLGTTAIEASEPGEVIVMEQRTGIDAACWGGNLSFGARLRRVAGVIVDGPVRDIDEAREYEFPVFARSTTAHTARGRIKEGATDVPITVGDVIVRPGDYVVADGSAVVFIANAEIARVLEAAEAIAARERAMVAALRDGTPISEVMGRNYETMLNK
ncbi:MAG TPA: RraA family protein [Vicinamibacterales bacterium]|nr:RraA family protein [Vicinamibacterales bacterium]